MEDNGAAPGAVRVKVEPAGPEHGRGHVSDATQCLEDEAVVAKEDAVKQELYTDHEVRDELVLGPVCLQEPAACSETEVTVKLEPGSVDHSDVKEDPECGSETAGSSGSETEQRAQHSERLNWPILNGVTVKFERESVGEADVKEEPECGSETAGWCGRETEQLPQHSERQSWPTLTIEPIGGSWLARGAPRPARPLARRPSTECHVCAKQFKEPSKLKEHMRAHTGEKPYPCKTCDKRFARRSILKVHERTHTGEKPFCCEICNKRFTDARSLKTHDLIHVRNPYTCDVCGRNFADPDTLREHKLFHISGETE